jgi:opacity protein-like surface antigen
MVSLRHAAVAGLTLLATTAAVQAADYIPYEPKMIEPLPPMELRGGVYLRGHIGMTNQRLRKLDFPELYDPNRTFEFLDKGGFDAGMLAGGGIGYQFNEWLRMDVTGEYRGKTHFSALDRYDDGNTGVWNGTNEYSAKKSEWLILLNAYADLGTWHGLTPYVGAGIGTSRNTISHLRDINTPNGATWYANDASKWNLAWALHAGVGYEVTDQLTLDLAYRYVDLGDARTGAFHDARGNAASIEPMHFKRITSHDVLLGLRWNFGSVAGFDDTYDYGLPVRAKN